MIKLLQCIPHLVRTVGGWGILIFLSLLGCLNLGKKALLSLLNSDSLYLCCVYRDLFIDGFGLSGWVFSPAPCFFPDMLLFFPHLFLLPEYPARNFWPLNPENLKYYKADGTAWNAAGNSVISAGGKSGLISIRILAEIWWKFR